MPEIIFSENYMKIRREEGDPKFYGTQNAKGESNFFYWLKSILNKEYGYDLIKKRMWKDGHMVDDMQQYLRTRSPKSNGAKVAIYNPNWAIYGAEEEWNKGEVTLAIMQNYFEA
jgi:hypothetical protein